MMKFFWACVFVWALWCVLSELPNILKYLKK